MPGIRPIGHHGVAQAPLSRCVRNGGPQRRRAIRRAEDVGDFGRVEGVQPLVASKGYAPWGTIDGKILPEQLVEIFDRRLERSSGVEII